MQFMLPASVSGKCADAGFPDDVHPAEFTVDGISVYLYPGVDES